MKVLIVDDSPDALRIAKARLAKEELDILCADGGTAGLEVARREHPDLILLDLDMPDLSGFDVCRMLKSETDLSIIPVLFLAGTTTPEDKVKALDLGAIDFISKPFDAFELCARVRAALRTKYLQDLLIQHANIDPLTGLPNRRALMDSLQREWARMQRYGGQLSFVLTDIDRFKQVNDTYGHPVGDQVLRAIAALLTGQCRKADLPTRYGGDEFAIVAPQTPASGAAVLADRLRCETQKIAIDAAGHPVSVTMSFGVADAAGLETIDDLVRCADKALYRAKLAGRNTVESSGACLPPLPTTVAAPANTVPNV
jgi:two-component system, cell cycle response regulator